MQNETGLTVSNSSSQMSLDLFNHGNALDQAQPRQLAFNEESGQTAFKLSHLRESSDSIHASSTSETDLSTIPDDEFDMSERFAGISVDEAGPIPSFLLDSPNMLKHVSPVEGVSMKRAWSENPNEGRIGVDNDSRDTYRGQFSSRFNDERSRPMHRQLSNQNHGDNLDLDEQYKFQTRDSFIFRPDQKNGRDEFRYPRTSNTRNDVNYFPNSVDAPSYRVRNLSSDTSATPVLNIPATQRRWDDTPTRYLQIAGLPRSVESAVSLEHTLKDFGNLQGIWAKRLVTDGVVVVGYFDLRDSLNAFRSLYRNRYFHERTLDAQFISHESIESIDVEGTQMFNELHNGEIMITISGPGEIKQEKLYHLFSSYGNINSFECIETICGNAIICAFYDIRDAALAVKEVDYRVVFGCRLRISVYKTRQYDAHSVSRAMFHRERVDGEMTPKAHTSLITPGLSPHVVPPTDLYPSEFRSRAQNLERSRTRPSQYHYQQSNLGAGADSRYSEVAKYSSRAVYHSNRSSEYDDSNPPSRQSFADLDSYVHKSSGNNWKETEPSSSIGHPSSSERNTPQHSPEQQRMSYADRTRANLPVQMRRSISYDSSRLSTRKLLSAVVEEGHQAINGSRDYITPVSSPPIGTDPKNKVQYGSIAREKDLRTTVMLKNIPNKFTQDMLKTWLDETSAKAYDFFYLRMDL